MSTRTELDQNKDSTFIRRTLVEHGLRPVNDVSSASTAAAITTIVRQHQDEQKELQELNAKFAVYLDRVQYLESLNQRLQNELSNLKQAWGGDVSEVQSMFEPQLNKLRQGMDDSLRDQALHELRIKRSEYDIWQLQQQIAALDYEQDKQRFQLLQQEFDGSQVELEHLRNQLDEKFSNLNKQRQLAENLLKQLNDLKNELDTQQLERIMLENEVQTLREHAAFQDAIYQSQRNDILSLSTPVIDVSRFYRTELARAISDIRHDFDILSQSQANELEEYYRVKTEQVRAEIESENERKRLLASEGVVESMDKIALTSSLKDNQTDLHGLQQENKHLQALFDAIVNDFEKIQDEHLREQQGYEQELTQLRNEINGKQDVINSLLENNVSLRFELSTYRRLLDVEEQHIKRVEQGQQQVEASLLSSSSSSSRQSNQALNDLTTKKMTVQKTARGPVSFDSVDLETDSISLVNERFSGNDQSLKNWTIRRQIDEKPEIVFEFPSTFSLRPRQNIRIFAKQSSHSNKAIGDRLVADRVNTWGIGQKMITRLIDDNNEEKAVITQIFQ